MNGGIKIYNNINDLLKDLPQLIVAIDSCEDDANYVHISDVRENTTYYCPCCKGIIKPRAYKKDIEYQVQPHFYHEKDGCSEESFIHFICKEWLFERGCKFMVSGNIFTVKSIETEKTLHTTFGDYRPDIIVITEEDKTFFFEIKYSNKKTEHYIPKWDELGNDVVEVDVRYFINQKFENDIPKFNVIYSDGECFIKSYTRSDYDEIIAKRKIEWKRQDKLNYKIQWERLDWFWNELRLYKENKSTIECVTDKFKVLEFKDMDFCMQVIKKMRCHDLFDRLISIINSTFYKLLETQIEEYGVSLSQRSPRIFTMTYKCYTYKNITYFKTKQLKKSVKYYGNDVYQFIIDSINKDNNVLYFPHFNKFKELIDTRNIIDGLKLYVFIEDCYIIAKNKFDETVWSYLNYGREKYIWNDSFFITIKQEIAKYAGKKLSNAEKIMKQSKNKKMISQVYHVQKVINMINSCKNKFWYSEKCNSTNNIYIYFRDSNGDKSNYLKYGAIVSININDSLYDIFIKTKQTFMKIINKDYGDLRIMVRG